MLRYWRLLRPVAKLVPRPVKDLIRKLADSSLESLPNSPDLFHVYHYLNRHPDLARQPGGWRYRGRFYPDYLTIGGASHAIFREALRFCQGKGIDVGAGLWPLPDAIPVDIQLGQGAGKTVSEFTDDSLDYVFSSHCLEHIEGWRKALVEWVRKIRPGGILFLYLPHPDCAIWHPGSPFVGDGHKWIPKPEVIRQAVSELGCDIIGADDGPDAMQSFYVCARKKTGMPLS